MSVRKSATDSIHRSQTLILSATISFKSYDLLLRAKSYHLLPAIVAGRYEHECEVILSRRRQPHDLVFPEVNDSDAP